MREVVLRARPLGILLACALFAQAPVLASTLPEAVSPPVGSAAAGAEAPCPAPGFADALRGGDPRAPEWGHLGHDTVEARLHGGPTHRPPAVGWRHGHAYCPPRATGAPEEPSLINATILPPEREGREMRLAVHWRGEPGARLTVVLVEPGGPAWPLLAGRALEPGVNLLPLPLDAPIPGGSLRLGVHEDAGNEIAAREIGFSTLAASSGFAWKSTFLAPGLDEAVYAMVVWDDGSGPALYVGGAFATIGDQVVHHIARWDGSQWHGLTGSSGTGMSGAFGWASVSSLAVHDGDLVAGGSFTWAGGVFVNNIARWDGSEWHPFSGPSGTGTSGSVYALAVYGGDLVAGGWFSQAGGIVVNGIARWDGSGWSPFLGSSGNGVAGGVYALTGHGDDLVAGGAFETAGGVTVNRVARWDGSDWFPLAGPSGTGVGGDDWVSVSALAQYDGELIVGGWFPEAGGVAVNNIARWDGSQWHALAGPSGTGTNGHVEALAVYDGELVAGGWFWQAGGVVVNSIARWDGSGWSPFVGSSGTGAAGGVYALTGHGNDLVAGGWFLWAGGLPVDHLARWDGSEWSAVSDLTEPGSAVEGDVYALTVYDGDLVAGGWFARAGGVLVNHVARWDGSQWHPFSGPFGTGTNGSVHALAVHDGDLVAGGWFGVAGGIVVNGIARWDGTGWSPFLGSSGTGVAGGVYALTGHGDNLVVGGSFETAGGVTVNHVARWDGSDWFPLAGPSGTGVGGDGWVSVSALAVYDGELIVGGWFPEAGGVAVDNIARWDGSQWHALAGPSGAGTSSQVGTLAVYDGDLIAGGWFWQAGGIVVNSIARWDGSGWSPLVGSSGTGVAGGVRALTVHDGDLVAGGWFPTAGGVTVNHIALWDGAEWAPFTGPSGTGTNGEVDALTSYGATPFGSHLAAAGWFTLTGGVPNRRIGLYGPLVPECGGSEMLLLEDEEITTTELYMANGTLVAGSGFRILTGGDVTFRVCGKVVVTGGFSVEGGRLKVQMID
jgi:hypothetical protein